MRAGTLDDTSWLMPVAHVWTRSVQPWMRFSDEALVFATAPDSYGQLFDVWKSRQVPE